MPMTSAWKVVSTEASCGPCRDFARFSRPDRRAIRPGAEPALPDEQRGEDQGHRREQLDQDVERWTGGVLEWIADRVANDGGRVSVGLLAQDIAGVIEQVTRLDVLLGVVPRPAAVVQDGGQHDA